MLKSAILAPPVANVVQSGVALLTLDPGPRYQQVIVVATAVKTSPTAGAAFDLALSDVLNLINLKVNTVSKRQHLAQELNEVQLSWDADLAAVYYGGFDNNFNVIANTTATYNSVACTTRTGTWVIALNLGEPSRDSYAARQFFAWPTSWVNNGTVVSTANLQIEFTVPGPSTITNYVALASMPSSGGYYNIANPAIRAEIVTDTVTGSFQGDVVSGGAWVTSSASTSTLQMPVTHWYRQPESYTNTTPVIRKWPFTGYLQQTSIFSPLGSGDDVVSFVLKKNNVNIFNSFKKTNDTLKLDWGWNPGKINTSAGDVTNTTWISADVFHLACDFDDDPTSALQIGANDTLEIDLTLAQNTASNKTLVFLSQVYRDALSAS